VILCCSYISAALHSCLNLLYNPCYTTGFASNGKGGVDAAEFCEAVKALLYNLIGEHAARAGEVQARYNGSAEGKQAAEDDVQPLMVEICEGIVTHDK
jgi:hypothetical protein